MNLDLTGIPLLSPHIAFVVTPVVRRKNSRSIIGSRSIGGPHLFDRFNSGIVATRYKLGITVVFSRSLGGHDGIGPNIARGVVPMKR